MAFPTLTPADEEENVAENAATITMNFSEKMELAISDSSDTGLGNVTITQLNDGSVQVALSSVCAVGLMSAVGRFCSRLDH